MTDEGERTKYLLELAGIPTGPEQIYDVLDVVADLGTGGPVSVLESLSSRDLGWLEVKMLSMGKEIFDDMAWMHIAYHYGGIEALESSLLSSEDRDTLDAWLLIDSGVPNNVREGTQRLIVREQRDTIQDDWSDIRHRHGPVGLAVTTFLTWTAENPVPEGRPYRDVVTRPTGIPKPVFKLPDLAIPHRPFVPISFESLETVRGNVANYPDRKEWIDAEIEPVFQQLATEHPEQLEAILRSPFAERVKDQRLLPLPYPGKSP
jgi:hypothetical protein